VCNGTQCAYEIRYGDGSGFDADVLQDSMTISGLSPVTQVFGAITSEENGGGGGQFEPYPTDGIIGFAYQALSECKAPTAMDNLAASGQVEDIFSMCMTNDGGSLSLGGSGNWYHGDLQWTPIKKKLWYVVNVEGVSVGGKALGLGHFALNGLTGAIVDSGKLFPVCGCCCVGW
jgi:Eukaryotic aspartyl protease